ncbi:MAG: hypothetical protein C4524_09530 [Candidatus Zixiibacteriota bacterium]|nr:MAG: hypothetical protein C4524_09530 [candidate division Zixibacteria bacterium]
MMTRILKPALVAVLLLTAARTFAFDKVGTTAAQFLQIGVGGRLPALGGAGVAAVEGAEALYWNPARLTARPAWSLSAYYADWIADLRHQFVGLGVPLGPSTVLGVSAVGLSAGEFEQTTVSFQEGNGVMVEYFDLALGVSLAQRLTDRFSAGGTVKYIHQKLFAETASALAVDLGTSLATDLPGFTIGMAMTNLGGEMTLDGPDLLAQGSGGAQTEYQVSSWPLPLNFQVGLAWRLLGRDEALWHNATHQALLVADGQHLNEGMTRGRIGVEYGLARILYLRGGRVIGADVEDWTVGAGLNLELRSFRVSADFAWADFGDLQSVQRISLTLAGR